MNANSAKTKTHIYMNMYAALETGYMQPWGPKNSRNPHSSTLSQRLGGGGGCLVIEFTSQESLVP